MDSKVMMGLALLFAGVMDVVMAIVMPQRIPDPAKQRIMRNVLGVSGGVLLLVGTLLATRVL
jgi:hypothetical protein